MLRKLRRALLDDFEAQDLPVALKVATLLTLGLTVEETIRQAGISRQTFDRSVQRLERVTVKL